MLRGEVVWLDPDPVRGSEQSGRRPAVIVSRDAVNRTSPVVMVVPFTTFRGGRLYPSDVLVRAPEGGLAVDSVAMALQMRAASVQRLSEPLGSVTHGTMQALERAICNLLDIDRQAS